MTQAQIKVPQDVIDAAEKVGKFFAERNIAEWSLGPCQSRRVEDPGKWYEAAKRRREFADQVMREVDEVKNYLQTGFLDAEEWRRRHLK